MDVFLMKEKKMDNFKNVMIVKNTVKLFKSIHGENYTNDDIFNEVVSETIEIPIKNLMKLIAYHTEKPWDTEDAETQKTDAKYGMFIGRCQPFHKGHQEIINEILLEGLIPIIVLGSSNDNRDKHKNPLTYAQRKELIRTVFPNVSIVFIRGIDYENWDEWFHELTNSIKTTLKNEFDATGNLLDDIILFSHNKEVDRTTFSFNSKEYTNTFYTDIFVDQGFKLKQIEFVKRTDVKIDANARDIRDNIEGMKHLLDARIFWKLKEWLW
jgi:cytidyltransferase-like protein